MSNTNLPHRFREASFRRYEHAIDTVVTLWPKVIVINPAPLALETYAARFRDSCRSLLDNQWETCIDMSRFFIIADDIVVSLTANPGSVTIGPEDRLAKLVPAGTPIEDDAAQQFIPKINLVDPPEDLIRAILVLHHHRILTEPSAIRTTFDVITASIDYDIAVENNENTYTIL
jgi:hypothetical protein